MQPKIDERKQQRKRKYHLTLLILVILLLAALFVVQCQLSSMKADLQAERDAALDSIAAYEKHRADSLKNYNDSLAVALAADSLARYNDSIAAYNDSVANANKKTVSPEELAREKARRDSIEARNREIRDSIAREKKALEDSLKAHAKAVADSIEAYNNRDSIPPQATILPPEGRYYEPIQLKVKCDEYKCKTFYSIGDTSNIQELTAAVSYNKTGDVYYFAEDSAGNRTAWQKVHYDMASDNVCGTNAYPVPVNGKTICVDAYEYPNKPGEIVKDMVSHDQAVQLCEQAGKRLCYFDEWSAACKGKDGTKYSYGNSYRQSKCNTSSKAAKRAGRKEACRSWYGMYDMNGNLWEWTATPASAPNRFLVAGGAWDTHNESQCTSTKYSFYPQNQYNFVGFRCCKNAD